MAMNEDTCKVVRCPACGRTSKVPLTVLVFNCVFCGCRINANRVWVISVHHSQTAGRSPTDEIGHIDLVLRWRHSPWLWWALLAVVLITLLAAFRPALFLLAGYDPLLTLGLAPVGLAAGYVAVAKMVNHSDLHVDPQELAVSHRPLPWLGEVHLHTGEIAGFSVHKVKKGRFVQYQLVAEMKDDRQVPLLGGLEYQETARFLQDRLHAYLRSLG